MFQQGHDADASCTDSQRTAAYPQVRNCPRLQLAPRPVRCLSKFTSIHWTSCATGRCEKGERMATLADNRKLRVPAIASVTICGTLHTNNFRKRWHQPFFISPKMVIALLTFCKILCNQSPKIESKRPQLEQEFRERNFAQKKPNNSNCAARCYN